MDSKKEWSFPESSRHWCCISGICYKRWRRCAFFSLECKNRIFSRI